LKLLQLDGGQNKVVAAYSNRGDDIPVIDFLINVPSDMSSHVNGIQDLFERYAHHGRDGLTSVQFHESDKNKGIWAFRKGRLRIYCFIDEGQLIATHGAIKSTQKAKLSDVNRAERVKLRYFTDKQAGNIELEID